MTAHTPRRDDTAAEAQAAGDALERFAEVLSARIPDSPTKDHEDAIGVILALRAEANQKKIQAASLRRAASETPATTPEAHRPRRGDAVATWLKEQRDAHLDGYGKPPEWHTLDRLLDLYRLHADTGTPLGQDVREPGGEEPGGEEPAHPF